MRRFIIFISLISILFCNLASAQPNPGNYRIIYGNRDGTPISAYLGETIDLPIWACTAHDQIASMVNPMASNDLIVPERLGGYCTMDTGCFCTVTNISFLSSCLFNTNGDTLQIGVFTMRLTTDQSYLGQTVHPFSEGLDPDHGGPLWIFADGMTMIIPAETFGALQFSTCNAIPGDANGDGVFNAVDLVYGVNYFKGIGDPPASWDCPGHGSVFVGADANGNCVFNAIDITYCVNYLKGHGTAPRRCPSC